VHLTSAKATGTITPMIKAYVWVKPNFGHSSIACSQVYVYENKYICSCHISAVKQYLLILCALDKRRVV
jgi:hypothetical protein